MSSGQLSSESKKGYRKQTAESRDGFLTKLENTQTPPKSPAASTVSNTPIKIPGPPPNTPADSKFTYEPTTLLTEGLEGSIDSTTETLQSLAINDARRHPVEHKETTTKTVAGKSQAAHFAGILEMPSTPNKRPVDTELDAIVSPQKKHKTHNDTASKYHPMMIFFNSINNHTQGRVLNAVKFQVVEGKEVQVLDDNSQMLWDTVQNHFSRLSGLDQAHWATKVNCFLEEDGHIQYDDDTHCLVEFSDPKIRYSCQFYRGVSTWYIKSQDMSLQMDIFHPCYSNNILVPRSHRIFTSLESLAKRHWDQKHQDCWFGHFRVNVLLDNDLYDSHSKFITHRVCGQALVADLIHAMQGSTNGKEREESKIWQSLKEVLWDEEEGVVDEFLWHEEEGFFSGIGKRRTVNFGQIYDYESLKSRKTMMKDMEWFKRGRDWTWLSPCRREAERCF